FNIPYSTLHDKRHEKYKRPACGSGSTPWVPKEGGEVLTEPQVLKKLEEEELSKK
ncbi:hypothetical protein BpHYR1_040924, partial [Brachionus plicatilis]